MTARKFTPTAAQERAINQIDGRLFIAAGAGSGKTEVVAQRFVEAIARGTARVNEILTITFTRKAAAEMLERVRAVLGKRIDAETDPQRIQNLKDAYRDIDRARIGTIDSFYSQVLKSHALVAGIDPGFKVLEQSQSQMIRREAFESCLDDFVEKNQPDGAELIIAYDPNLDGALFSAIDGIHNAFRSRGQRPALPLRQPRSTFDTESKALLAAIDDFGEAVRREGCQGTMIDKNLECCQTLMTAAGSADADAAERIFEKVKIDARGSPKVKKEARMVEAARKACLLHLQSLQAKPVIMLMDRLLKSYADQYRYLKQQRGMLDFADLSLLVRDLLLSHVEVRDRLSAGFKLVMVDEFQDTSLLQYQIGSMLSRNNLMTVGDRNQSIYRFRDARIELFDREDELARKGDYRVPLLENFRSQPEILRFVDHLFDAENMLGSRYLKLIPAAGPEPAEEQRVEVIFVDVRPPGREKKLLDGEAREVEAELIAERLGQLFRPGQGYAPGDAALLLQTRKHAEVYRDALKRRGIDCYLAIGDSYFQQLGPGVMIAAFRLLLNPLDDEALVTVLRSPMVGVSDDALYWLRHAPDAGRFFWPTLKSGLASEYLAETEVGRLDKFAARLEELRLFARRHSLRDTTRRLLDFNDYAAIEASAGRQQFANLVKLLDLAAQFEATWGRDLAAFTKFLVHQKSLQAREPDAPISEEGVNAVRIMTMHSAKGLEFPLVVLPKLGGKKGGSGKASLLLAGTEEGSKQIGMVLKRPGRNAARVFDYEELGEAKRRGELEEEKRLHYVAMTRAKRHLILAGSASADKPAATGEDVRPFEWIRARLRLDRVNRPGLDGISVVDDLDEVSVSLTVCADPDALLAQAAADAPAAAPKSDPVKLDSNINRLPGGSVFIPATVSPTALDTYSHCPRRFYLDSVLRLGDVYQSKSAGGGDSGGLTATQLGSLVHKMLEKDLRSIKAELPQREMIEERSREAFGGTVKLTDDDIARVRRRMDNFRRTPAAGALLEAAAAGALMQETVFSTLVGGTILQGQIDAMFPLEAGGSDAAAEGGFVVVDYKTGEAGGEAGPKTEVYRWQLACYALAAGRMQPGPVRVVLIDLGGDEPVEIRQDFTPPVIEKLAADIASLIEGMSSGDFPPLKFFDKYYCMWCSGGPNRAAICHVCQ